MELLARVAHDADTCRDPRAILYVTKTSIATAARHRYVQVRCSGSSTACFAQLRPAAGGQESSLSYGLYVALQVPSSAKDLIPLTITEISDAQVDSKASRCNCKTGEIVSMRLRFLDRARPPRAVVTSLQRIATQVRWITLYQYLWWRSC